MQVVQLAAHGSHKPIVVADADQLEAGGSRAPADTPRGTRRPEGERRRRCRLPPAAVWRRLLGCCAGAVLRSESIPCLPAFS